MPPSIPMPTSPFDLAYHSEQGALQPASALLAAFQRPDAALLSRMAAAYGEEETVLQARAAAAVQVLERFLECYGDLPCALYRAPGRISLNPHCDHQGAWVPYGLHRRELLAVVAPADDERVEIVNVDPEFATRLEFSVTEEIGRAPEAWASSWFEYIEAPAVVEETRHNLDTKTQHDNRHATLNYVKAGVLRMHHGYPAARFPGLRLALNGDIPQGAGQSSSSTLVVTAALALAQFSGLSIDRRLLAEQCGEAEWYVGTRGGSGDHAAILLGSREGLAHLCFRAPFGVRGARYSSFPTEYQLVLCNSLTRSEKSAEERLLFNRGIFAYRFAFLALHEAMQTLGMDAKVIEETESLGHLNAAQITNADLYRLIMSLPESISCSELAIRFPDRFEAAARGCFGTTDLLKLPTEIPLRGAAVYGLGRVDRGQVMPQLLEQADVEAMQRFGRLMTITHDGDRLFRYTPAGETEYLESRERLADVHLSRALAVVEAGQEHPLCEEPGFYGASIRELDRLVDLALGVDGVLGAGLMGAGGGGYVLALVRRDRQEALRATLEREYYAPLGKPADIEAWHPSAAACRLA